MRKRMSKAVGQLFVQCSRSRFRLVTTCVAAALVALGSVSSAVLLSLPIVAKYSGATYQQVANARVFGPVLDFLDRKPDWMPERPYARITGMYWQWCDLFGSRWEVQFAAMAHNGWRPLTSSEIREEFDRQERELQNGALRYVEQPTQYSQSSPPNRPSAVLHERSAR